MAEILTIAVTLPVVCNVERRHRRHSAGRWPWSVRPRLDLPRSDPETRIRIRHRFNSPSPISIFATAVPATMPDACPATARLHDVLRRVPAGRVVTYGQLADLAGRPGRARWAARTLRHADDPDLPWHRVIAAGGRIALPADSPAGLIQRERLHAEGVPFRGERVDLSLALWRDSLADLLFG